MNNEIHFWITFRVGNVQLALDKFKIILNVFKTNKLKIKAPEIEEN